MHGGIVRDREVEDTPCCEHAQPADGRGGIDRARGIDACRAAQWVHRVHDLRQRFIHVGRLALDLSELADFQHLVIATESQRHRDWKNRWNHGWTLIKPDNQKMEIREKKNGGLWMFLFLIFSYPCSSVCICGCLSLLCASVADS